MERLLPELVAIRRRTAVAVYVLLGLVSVEGVGGALWLLQAPNARRDNRPIWALCELRDAEHRFAQLDPDGDGRSDFGTLEELDRAGLLGDPLRGAIYGADHAYEVFLHPTEPTRWLAIAHPLRRGVQAYALTDGPAVSASNEDILGTTECVIPAGCWRLGR